MKVKILRDTVADGRDVYAGEVHDISSSDAKLLARMGKALIVEEMEGQAPVVLTTMSGPEVDPFKETKKPGRPRKG